MGAVKIKAFVKRPDERFGHSTWISNSLEALQKTVDGYIETVTIEHGLVVICNEEGRINGMKPNVNFCGIDFYGPIAVVGQRGAEFADVPIMWSTYLTLIRPVKEG